MKFIRRHYLKSLSLPLAAVILSIACTQTKIVSKNPDLKASSEQDIVSQWLSDSLDALMKTIAAEFNQPEMNLTLGVIKDGKVLLKKHYGFSNTVTNTRFSDKSLIYIASTSKSFTGTLAAILDKKGVVKLDKPIAEYLPGFQFNSKELKPDQITVRSLHTHTNRINNNALGLWTAFLGHKGNEHIIDLLKEYSQLLSSEKFTYSNNGPVVYSLLVEAKTGEKWQRVMERELFRPLGMKSTSCYVSNIDKQLVSYVLEEIDGKDNAIFDKEDNTMSAAGGHITTVDDMLTYLRFFISRGASVPGLLNKEEIEYAISPIVPQSNKYQSYGRYGFGLGWEQSVMNDEEVVSRFGGYSGISSHLSFLRDKNIGVVALSNKKGFESLEHLVANYIYNSLLGKSNKNEIFQANLAVLKRNFEGERVAKNRLENAVRSLVPNPTDVAGHYEGIGESGSMDIDKVFNATWGNLQGRLYTLTDTTGMLNFGSMTRSVNYKKQDGKVIGIYSNERYFRKIN